MAKQSGSASIVVTGEPTGTVGANRLSPTPAGGSVARRIEGFRAELARPTTRRSDVPFVFNVQFWSFDQVHPLDCRPGSAAPEMALEKRVQSQLLVACALAFTHGSLASPMIKADDLRKCPWIGCTAGIDH